jgi:hypothetical protein
LRPLKRSNSEFLNGNLEENAYLVSNLPNKRKICKSRSNNQLFKQTNNNLIINQTETDSNFYKNLITQKHIMFIASKAGNYWKEIAREMDICEAKINEIDSSCEYSNDLTKKLYQVINIWIQNVGFIKATYSNLINILSICKLNAIKGKKNFLFYNSSSQTNLNISLN